MNLLWIENIRRWVASNLVLHFLVSVWSVRCAADENSLLWRVAAPNGKVSYLFGTFHSANTKAYQHRRPVLEAFGNSDVVFIEWAEHFTKDSEEPLPPEKLRSSLNLDPSHLELMNESYINDRKSVITLTKEDRQEAVDSIRSLVSRIYARLSKRNGKSTSELEEGLGLLARARGTIRSRDTIEPETLANEVEFFRELLYIANRPYSSPRPTSNNESERPDLLDTYIGRLSFRYKKDLRGLESFKENASMAALVHIAASKPMAVIRYGSNDSPLILEQYSPNENIAWMGAALSDSTILGDLYDSLVTQRNTRWVERLDTVMPKHTCFIAVGAGHLPGRHGLLSLLRTRGYAVEPVTGGERIDIQTNADEILQACKSPSGFESRASADSIDRIEVGREPDQNTRDSVTKQLLSALKKEGVVGLVTVIFKFMFFDVGGGKEGQVTDVVFTDRPEIHKSLRSSIGWALMLEHNRSKYRLNHLFEVSLQIDLSDSEPKR